jgi:hypothetical protein
VLRIIKTELMIVKLPTKEAPYRLFIEYIKTYPTPIIRTLNNRTDKPLLTTLYFE